MPARGYLTLNAWELAPVHIQQTQLGADSSPWLLDSLRQKTKPLLSMQLWVSVPQSLPCIPGPLLGARMKVDWPSTLDTVGPAGTLDTGTFLSTRG